MPITQKSTTLSFKAFRQGDIRGLYPEEVNSEFAYQFGIAYANTFKPEYPIVVGYDQRATSQELKNALIQGLIEAGVNVTDIGLCPTELVYFAATLAECSGAIMVTASHNCSRYNGFKPVTSGAKPITANSGLNTIEQLMQQGDLKTTTQKGDVNVLDIVPQYVNFIRSCYPNLDITKYRLAANGMNGCAPILANPLFSEWGVWHHWLNGIPSQYFHSDGPNPVKPQHLDEMKNFMQQREFTLGIAWDGDGDRCLFFDSNGEHIETYYMIGLLIQATLHKHPGSTIVFDPKIHWNTLDIIKQFGGNPKKALTGHAFVKQQMAEVDAQYGGEHSAHHYFKEFNYCDSGMFPWLCLLDYLTNQNIDLTTTIAERRAKYQILPEINIKLESLPQAFKKLNTLYANKAISVDQFDGMSYEFKDGWRFNIRSSNTEPLIRLNFESCNGKNLLHDKAHEVITHLKPLVTSPVEMEEL